MRTSRPSRRRDLTGSSPRSSWDPLDPTSQAVAVAVLRRGPISRADLARRLQLSTPTLTRIVRQLMDAGIVIELAPTQISHTGRPSLPIAIDPQRAWFVGFKIVTDCAYAVLCDLSGTVHDTVAEPLPDTDVDTVVDRIVAVVTEQRRRQPQVAGVGIALAAVVDDGRTVRSSRFLGWSQIDLADRIEAITGVPCVLNNDVRAFTLAEHWFGTGRGLSSFAVITVGAGVGGGLVMSDQLVNGPRGRSGMIGHTLVDPGGRVCHENHRGCAAQTLSNHAIAAQLSDALGRPVGFDEGIALADDEPVVERVLQHASRCLGRLAGSVANLADPERILLSGEGIGWVREDGLERGLAETRYDQVAPTPVIRQQIDMHEWARGAAADALRSYVLA